MLTVSGEAGSFIPASARTPFWLRSNQYGIIPYSMPAATGRLSASLDYDSLRLATGKLSYGGAINAVANVGATTQWLLPESYVKFRYGVFEFYAGRRRELFGLADSTLSTGSYAWSGNALPVPKVQLEIRPFTPLTFTRGFVAVKGSFAHGWLGGRYVQHTMLHQKSLYVRLGKPNSKWKLYGGVNHQVVWGGYSDDLVKIGLVKSPYLPSSFKDYLNVVSGLKADATGIVDSLAYANFDLTNRIGNHVGSVDVAVEFKTDRFIYYAYRQNPYETGAFFRGNSFADGLNGLRIRSTNPNAFIQQLLIEYLNTANQGGDDFGKGKNGKVNYFNHSQFRDGWSYASMGLGTPFITPAYSTTGELPYGGFSNNNRVQVWHIGLSGTLLKPTRRWLNGPITYQIKGSFSHNLGTYNAPFANPLNQFSGIVSFQVPLSYWKGLLLQTSLSADNGSLYTNGFGMYVGVRKEWSRRLR
ncbi:capsule assembly Wzi family protein [Spirosoma sp. SC4-14]|uniref:capsule assembly Wzi family protein n=1 Tax=Spirosoma sp. SC4-14 TaxID=3128900 RepID=UPI0030D59DC3